MVENYYPIEFDSAGDTFTVVNNGTAPAPSVITFIPKVDLPSLNCNLLSLTDIGIPRFICFALIQDKSPYLEK